MILKCRQGTCLIGRKLLDFQSHCIRSFDWQSPLTETVRFNEWRWENWSKLLIMVVVALWFGAIFLSVLLIDQSLLGQKEKKIGLPMDFLKITLMSLKHLKPTKHHYWKSRSTFPLWRRSRTADWKTIHCVSRKIWEEPSHAKDLSNYVNCTTNVIKLKQFCQEEKAENLFSDRTLLISSKSIWAFATSVGNLKK